MVSASRPRTPSAGTSPPAVDKVAPLPTEDTNKHPARRSSLGLLLRRSKSGDLGSRGSKKQQALAREQELERQRREAAAIPKSPPILPSLYNGAASPQLPYADDRTESTPPRNFSRSSMDPARFAGGQLPPSTSNGSRHGEWVDPYARTESMTHRGRYSYASSAVSTINSPRRVRRRKDPTPFNVLIIGAASSGKTSFLEFLKTSLAPPRKRGRTVEPAEDTFNPQTSTSGNFQSHYLETEIDGERIGLTLWDSEGLQKNVVDLQLREMSSFLESKFEETFTEEMKVVRAPGVQDTHIHCAFLILDPARLDRNLAVAKAQQSNGNGANTKYASSTRLVGGLDEDLDLQILRTLQGKTTVVPVISKADTITTAHMAMLKKTVSDSLRKANLDPLEALGLDDFEAESPRNSGRIEEKDEEDEEAVEDSDNSGEDLLIQNPEAPEAEVEAEAEATTSPNPKRLSSNSIRRHARNASLEESGSEPPPYLPLSIISPDIYEPGVIGRKFPWGFADPMNVEHCDFMRLKDAVFSEWRGELREASRELWYEGWRTSRLKHRDPKPRR